MVKTAWQKRHRQSALVSLMLLRMCHSLHAVYRPEKSLDVKLPELLCAMVIHLNDARRRPPCTAISIIKLTGLPATSVKRYLRALVDREIIIKVSRGYCGSDAYLQTLVKSREFKRILRAVDNCALMLKKA
jgi:DNA-binding MarR family transcriptional regulator